MRAAHFSTSDFGGAYKAAARINEAMRSCGADSKIYVRTKKYNDTDCTEIIDTPLKSLLSKTKNFANLMLSKNEIICDLFGTDISRNAAVRDADVIILHWVNSFVSYSAVKKLAKTGKPVIWVMHDMWPYTGGCHYDYGCGRFAEGCGHCPRLGSDRKKDRSYFNFNKKKEMLEGSGIVIVSPSNWNKECSEMSGISAKNKKYVIYNPIDEDIYHPIPDITDIRKSMGFDPDRKLVIFGAMGQSVHKWEGVRMLKEAIDLLPSDIKNRLEFAVFGNTGKDSFSDMDMPVKALGYIHDEEEIARLYACADVFVSPSTADNYPNTLLEAICCGTPCVCFDRGGMGDLVKTGSTGYLAKAEDTADMSKGIEYVLKGDLKQRLSDPDKNPNLKENSYESIGRQYLELCSSLIER